MCGGARKGRYRLRADQSEVYEPPYTLKKPRKAPEQQFHMQVAKFIQKALPEGYFWTTFPAGGGGLVRGAKLKAMGLKPGLPDILIFGTHPNDEYPSYEDIDVYWLELKSKSGALSKVQKETIAQLKALGHQVEVCKTLDEVEQALTEFCFPTALKARLT